MIFLNRFFVEMAHELNDTVLPPIGERKPVTCINKKLVFILVSLKTSLFGYVEHRNYSGLHQPHYKALTPHKTDLR